ncbi:RNase P modulator RnpM [Lentibacillus salicampi]|uniref:YlxR family protein n=1 Tax=Lentibacillus salicampi TaxID=175306 RepID=A0A4Y9AFV2_9BACI|nr:YlxR family protein [Lentibacillus salicampi]TFJ94696.1 YlxR family protein [Lentibacillus salicampi]
MAKKKRKIPQRKCVVTNEMKPKQELIRIVRNKEGEVFVDPSGKKNGRGAYVTNDSAVIEQAEKTGILSRQLNAEIGPSIYEELKQFVTGHTNEG